MIRMAKYKMEMFHMPFWNIISMKNFEHVLSTRVWFPREASNFADICFLWLVKWSSSWAVLRVRGRICQQISENYTLGFFLFKVLNSGFEVCFPRNNFYNKYLKHFVSYTHQSSNFLALLNFVSINMRTI